MFNEFYKNTNLLLMHQVYSILKNLQRKKVSKPPMSKILNKVDECNKGTKWAWEWKQWQCKSRECTRERERQI